MAILYIGVDLAKTYSQSTRVQTETPFSKGFTNRSG